MGLRGCSSSSWYRSSRLAIAGASYGPSLASRDGRRLGVPARHRPGALLEARDLEAASVDLLRRASRSSFNLPTAPSSRSSPSSGQRRRSLLGRRCAPRRARRCHACSRPRGRWQRGARAADLRSRPSRFGGRRSVGRAALAVRLDVTGGLASLAARRRLSHRSGTSRFGMQQPRTAAESARADDQIAPGSWRARPH